MKRVLVRKQTSKRGSRTEAAPVESEVYDSRAIDRAQEIIDAIDAQLVAD